MKIVIPAILGAIFPHVAVFAVHWIYGVPLQVDPEFVETMIESSVIGAMTTPILFAFYRTVAK